MAFLGSSLYRLGTNRKTTEEKEEVRQKEK